jgi:hypothetical protein
MWLNVFIACIGKGGEGDVDASGSAPKTCETGECGEAACCIDTYGYGLEDPDDLEYLASRCEGEACDAARYLSEDAAVCLAGVCGLEEGLNGCYGWFQLGDTGGYWIVMNDTEECPDGANLCGGGDTVQVDAQAGTCEGTGSWAS